MRNGSGQNNPKTPLKPSSKPSPKPSHKLSPLCVFHQARALLESVQRNGSKVESRNEMYRELGVLGKTVFRYFWGSGLGFWSWVQTTDSWGLGTATYSKLGVLGKQ